MSGWTRASSWLLVGLAIVALRAVDGRAGPIHSPCTLPITVRATMVADGMPEWSLARLYNQETKHTGTYSINPAKSGVVAGAVLVEIHSLSVVLRTRAGLQRCWAEGHELTGPHPLASGVTKAVGPRDLQLAKPSPQVKALMQEFTRLRFDDYRGPLEGDIPGIWRENNRGIRNNDYQTKGTGFQLVKLRADTLVYELGLRNFDIVKQINGRAIDDPRKAIELLETLGGVEKLTVLLQRQGRDITLDVDF